MRKQIRIQSMHGSIGPVRKANAGRGGGDRASRGNREPEEAAGAGRSGGTHRTREEKKRKKGKRKRSEGSRVFDLCNSTSQVKKNKSKTPATRRRRRRAEPSFKRYPDVAK